MEKQKMREIEFWQLEIVTVMPRHPSSDEMYAIGYAKTLDGETVELKFKSVIHTMTKDKRCKPRWIDSNNWESHMRTRHKDLVENHTSYSTKISGGAE